MNKEILVAFIVPKIKQEWEALREGKFEDKQLYQFIDRAIDDLKVNPTCGTRNETLISFLYRNEVVSSFLV